MIFALVNCCCTTCRSTMHGHLIPFILTILQCSYGRGLEVMDLLLCLFHNSSQLLNHMIRILLYNVCYIMPLALHNNNINNNNIHLKSSIKISLINYITIL